MKVFGLNLRRRRSRQSPAWATESTTEANVVRHEAEALIAESRSYQRTSANTFLPSTIRSGLRGLDSPAKPSWHVVSGEQVTVGDIVMVDLGSVAQGTIVDVDPEPSLPLVRIAVGDTTANSSG